MKPLGPLFRLCRFQGSNGEAKMKHGVSEHGVPETAQVAHPGSSSASFGVSGSQRESSVLLPPDQGWRGQRPAESQDSACRLNSAVNGNHGWPVNRQVLIQGMCRGVPESLPAFLTSSLECLMPTVLRPHFAKRDP